MEGPPLDREAREVLDGAQQRATTLGYDRAQLHDILFALLEAPTALRVLELYGADTEGLKAALDHFTRAMMPIDGDAEGRTVDLARGEALRLGQSEIGSEHLLLALIRQPDQLGGGVLRTFGMTLDPTREAIRFVHGLVPDWERPAADPAGSEVSSDSFYVIRSEPSHDWLAVKSIPDEEIDRLRDESLADYEASVSELESVLGIGLSRDVAGIVVELIALEMRSQGSILLWTARPAEPRLIGTPRVSVSDDVGTSYRVRSGASGGEHGMRGEVAILPPPLRTARTLTVEFGSFRPGEWEAQLPPGWATEASVDGPWRFEISLRPRGT